MTITTTQAAAIAAAMRATGDAWLSLRDSSDPAEQRAARELCDITITLADIRTRFAAVNR